MSSSRSSSSWGGSELPALRSCLGFAVQTPDGPLGTVEAIAERERALAVGAASATTVVPVAEVELVDTASARILLRRSPAPSGPRTAAPAGPDGCACPTDFVCAGCGYGVAAGHLPRTCPMCGGHRWRPAHTYDRAR